MVIKTSAAFKIECQAPDFSQELFVINHKILQEEKKDFCLSASRKSVHLLDVYILTVSWTVSK